jgi:hypothetical protein
MGLLYYRTIFNHFVVIELFHDIQLTTSIRNPKLSLKRIPNFFATWQQKLRVHKVFSENTQDGTTKQVIDCLESLLLLWRKLFGLQPIHNPLLPTLVI